MLFFSFCCCCCCCCVFFFVELCRPVLYDVRNQSSFIAGGGGRGRSEHFGGIIWFTGGMDGEQWSLTDFKGGYTKLTANGAGSLKYYRDLWGYSGSFYCDMTNNPPPSPPPPPPHPLPPHVKWCLKITKLSPKVITNVRNGQRITEYQFSVSKTFCIFRWVLREVGNTAKMVFFSLSSFDEILIVCVFRMRMLNWLKNSSSKYWLWRQGWR